MNELFESSEEDFINTFDKYEDEEEFYPGMSLEEFEYSEDEEENTDYDTIGGSLY